MYAYSRRPGEGNGFPGTGVAVAFELPCGCWEPHLSPPQEPLVLSAFTCSVRLIPCQSSMLTPPSAEFTTLYLAPHLSVWSTSGRPSQGNLSWSLHLEVNISFLTTFCYIVYGHCNVTDGLMVIYMVGDSEERWYPAVLYATPSLTIGSHSVTLLACVSAY